MTEDCRPVCYFCCRRFSLAPGAASLCEDPRSGGEHAAREHPTSPELAARLRAPVDMKRPEQTKWEATEAYRDAKAQLDAYFAKPAAAAAAPVPEGQKTLF